MPLHKSCMLLFLFQNNKFPIYLWCSVGLIVVWIK
jgi:hypothetical protein